MDIAEISMNLSQNQLLSAVGTAMLGKTLDVVEGQAEALSKSMDMNSPSLESLYAHVFPFLILIMTPSSTIELRSLFAVDEETDNSSLTSLFEIHLYCVR